MKIIIYVILVPLCVILFCAFLYAGIKALLHSMRDKFRAKFFSRKSANVNPADAQAMMSIVTLTSGTCQSCGRTFIGTTKDSDSPLHVVKFMDETKIMCNDCLQKLIAEFNKTHYSTEKEYSQSAKDLKNMLAKVECGTKNIS